MLVVQTGRVLSPKMPPVAVNGENWAGACNEYGVHPGGVMLTKVKLRLSGENQ